MPANHSTDWNSLLSAYNKFELANYKDIRSLLSALYKTHHSLAKMESILGPSEMTLGRKMDSLGMYRKRRLLVSKVKTQLLALGPEKTQHMSIHNLTAYTHGHSSEVYKFLSRLDLPYRRLRPVHNKKVQDDKSIS